MPSLISEPLKIYYHASYFSFSTLACLLILVLSIVLSYLVVLYSGDLFIENIYEVVQPKITFNDQFILEILEDTAYKSYSSIIKYNDFYPNLLEVPLVKVSLFPFNVLKDN